MTRNEREGAGNTAVPLKDIRTDGEALDTQLRATLNDDVVTQYAEAIARGDEFPLVDLVECGDGTFFIADGWHRISARKRLGKHVIGAVIHAVPDGVKPLEAALKLALKANGIHGLHLTRGDQQKKASAALLHPAYQGWSLRALEGEIGIGKSTLGRVRTALIKEGKLAHPMFGAKMPEWVPESHASAFHQNEVFLDVEEMEAVYGYVERLSPQGDPGDWEWEAEEGRVVHSGLVEGKTVAFRISGNLIVDGMPSKWEDCGDASGHVDEAGNDAEPLGRSWKDMPLDELNRIEAARVRRELIKAAKRIKDRHDKELSRAVDTLLKRADEPGLWKDIQALVAAGGPAEEHTTEDF